MDIVFLFLCLTGITLLLFTVLMGELFEFGGDLAESIGIDLSPGLAADQTPSPFSSRVLFAALTGFGGFGYITSIIGLPPALVGLTATGGGFGVAALTFVAVVLPIARQQGSVTILRSDFVGVEVELALPLPAKGQGFSNVLILHPKSRGLIREQMRTMGKELPPGTIVIITEVTPQGVIVEPRKKEKAWN